jgi:hypothetical protein
VVEAIVSSEEKEHVGVVDKGSSSLVGVERIEAVSIAAAGAASGDIVKQVQQAQEAQQAAGARIGTADSCPGAEGGATEAQAAGIVSMNTAASSS